MTKQSFYEPGIVEFRNVPKCGHTGIVFCIHVRARLHKEFRSFRAHVDGLHQKRLAIPNSGSRNYPFAEEHLRQNVLRQNEFHRRFAMRIRMTQLKIGGTFDLWGEKTRF